jgi:hypothetical protein
MPPSVLSLDKVDPEKAWQPWEPDDKNPWNRKWAAHLYRRTAFGANLAELRQAEKDGLKPTLDKLLKCDPLSEEDEKFMRGNGLPIARTYRTPQPFQPVQTFQLPGWWLYFMLHSGHPLREKMTLFWHNHFATSIGKVQSGTLMFEQNMLIRKHALGKFEPFLLEMSKDPAMLKWLDSNSNIKGAPNENYAREIMELFSLGVGNYTEKDIREAARAFTGWHMDGEKYQFNANYHDDGQKTVLGETGNWDGGDIVKILLKQKACARFLVGKLYRFFVSETQDPPAALLEPLCEQLRKSEYDIGAVVRTMLSSRHFFSEHAFQQRLKSPVEFVLGAVRVTAEEGLPKGGVPQGALVAKIDAMGQQLFAPPNVKGWPGGQAWLNTSTVLARQNFGQGLAMGVVWRNAGVQRFAPVEVDIEPPDEPPVKKGEKPSQPEEPPPPPGMDAARIIRAEKLQKPEEVVNFLFDLYMPGCVSEATKTKLVAFVEKGNPEGKALDRRVREAAHAIMAMPEYQLA